MSDCIESALAVRNTGYAARSYKGCKTGAHRVAYIEAHGLSLSDIKGMLVLHSCDNRKCINPEHLSLGTYKDNYQDAKKKGRHTYGEKVGNHKLSVQDVLDIRKKLSEGCTAVETSKIFGVAACTISAIRTKRLWGWL